MAVLVSKATGLASASTTWGVVNAASYLNAETSSDALTTLYSGTRTQAFTPGAVEIDGIGVELANRTGTTGTMSVHLILSSDNSEVAGTEVTIDVADLPVAATADINGGWIFFKFAAPVTLAAATAYKLESKTSSASQVTLFRDGTTDNSSRFLRTTTEAAPGAGDDMIVCGDWTAAGTGSDYVVTWDITATTDFGAGSASLVTPALAVCDGGTFQLQTTAATNYNLKISGNIIVYSGGILNLGTSGTSLPSDSTFTMTLDCGTNVEYGIIFRNLSNDNGYGAPKTTVWTYLNTDEAAASTVIGVVSTSGWAAGDVLAFAPTTRTATESEVKTIDTVDSSTQVTLTAGLTNAHTGAGTLGTDPIGEVGNLTRNILIQGASATLQGYIKIEATAVVTMRYVEFKWLGSATSLKQGIYVLTTTGSVDMQYCSFHNFEVSGSYGIYLVGAAVNNVTFSNNVLYLIATSMLIFNTATTGTSITISGNLGIRTTVSYGFDIGDVGGTITNNNISGCQTGGWIIDDASGIFGTFSGNTAHSNTTWGFLINGTVAGGTMLNTVSWRNNTIGIAMQGSAMSIVVDGLKVFGSTTTNIDLTATSGHLIKNVTSNAGVTLTCPVGLRVSGGTLDVTLETSTFGDTTTHSTADINVSASGAAARLFTRNVLFDSTTEVNTQTNLASSGWIGSDKHDQTADSFKAWRRYGTITNDTVIYNTASPSLRMAPNNASFKLESAPMRVSLNSGQTATITAKVRESVVGDGTDYNGNRIRLMLLSNAALGVNSDTVGDTATASSEGAFEELSYTTPAAGQAGVFEFYFDCDGTLGWINVDDVAITLS